MAKPKIKDYLKRDPVKSLGSEALILFKALEVKYLSESKRTLDYLLDSQSDVIKKITQLENAYNLISSNAMDLKTIRADISSMNMVLVKIDEIQDEYDNLKVTMKNYENKFDKFTTEIREYKDQIESKDSQISTYTDQINDLNQKDLSRQEQAKDVQNKIKQLFLNRFWL